MTMLLWPKTYFSRFAVERSSVNALSQNKRGPRPISPSATAFTTALPAEQGRVPSPFNVCDFDSSQLVDPDVFDDDFGGIRRIYWGCVFLCCQQEAVKQVVGDIVYESVRIIVIAPPKDTKVPHVAGRSATFRAPAVSFYLPPKSSSSLKASFT